MSTAESEVEALARAFARHLEHLREFRGVHYVGAAHMPDTTADDDDRDHDLELAAADTIAQSPAPPAREDSSPPRYPSHAEPRSVARDAGPSVARDPGPHSVARDAGPHSVARDAGPHVPRDMGPSVPRDMGHPGPAAARGPAARAATSARPSAAARGEEWPAAKKLAYLRERNVGDCHRCPLAATRQNIVFGVGDPEAELMFVGEAPGADEDRLGEPFVGVAGQRLDRWLAQLGLGRDRVYIANVLKCRPPGNRDPHPMEIDRCSPFLHAQIRAIEPKVIVALGRFAGCLLLGGDAPLYKMRGQPQRYREPKTGVEIPVVVTYHPSYVIRTERKASGGRGPRPQTDRGGAIKSEDQKVLDDLERAVSLARAQKV
ncbi:Uracil-DNA glycosylase, family 4 [Enhygromyxa salina]|uniref:Type-4 uracil-DNA glycosylase n=1 Tax=Enhygromyxa salina TaxID=215803 RepID=A0A0C2A471_9BACT|nr:uracil-DNA glycosylase [Enhygromyxa salina]KIG18188.1 Uracil-DNA glycosylase, family 4 [Enhygromyxa salina]